MHTLEVTRAAYLRFLEGLKGDIRLEESGEWSTEIVERTYRDQELVAKAEFPCGGGARYFIYKE